MKFDSHFILHRWFLYFVVLVISSCSTQRQIQQIANHTLHTDSLFENARIGIMISEAKNNKILFESEANKLFIPASNVKLFTMYESLKYLQDSLTAFSYQSLHDTIFIMPTGDPTLLSDDFLHQPAIDFLKRSDKVIIFLQPDLTPEKYGRGWTWNDRNESYMPERNMLNVHKNLQHIRISRKNNIINISIDPPNVMVLSDSLLTDTTHSYIRRSETENKFFYFLHPKDTVFEAGVPLDTRGMSMALKTLASLNPKISEKLISNHAITTTHYIYSQPRDSVIKYMMYHSDNFYAEQLLMMAGMNKYSSCDEKDYIPKMMHSDFSDIPQKSRWVDGSGLSRYNLFSPADMVYILKKIHNEFGLDKIKQLLPTGGTGTLSNMMKPDSNYIFAKTGSMNSVYALSGLMVTQKGKNILFSVLINSFMGDSGLMKRRLGEFLHQVRITN